MNYNLRQGEQDVGVFSIDELRRRRAAGELKGNELVRGEGLSEWQPLDFVLREDLSSRSYLPPPPLPPTLTGAAPRSRVVGWLIGFAIVGALLVAGVFGYFFVTGMKLAREAVTRTRQEESIGGDSHALSLVSRPVVWNTNTMTEAKLLERRRQFRVRQYLEGYEQRGERNPSTDATALGFINNWMADQFGGTGDTNLPPLDALSHRLANDPACTDPLVHTISSIYAFEAREAVARLERALSGFEHSRHRAYPKFYATVSLGSHLAADRANRLPVLDATAVRLLGEAFKDGSFRPEDQAEIADLLVMGWARRLFDRRAAAICELARAQGEPFEWLALVLEGEHEIQEAWKARGGGYANTVSSEGWRGFAEHSDRARTALTKAWKLRPDLPLAPSRMIYVALGRGGLEEMRLWFDRTTVAQIDYPQAWKDMRWGLRPRWYGDYESMLAFGVTALNTRRFDTDVPRILFDSVTDLEAEYRLRPGEHLYGEDHIWPHLEQMYEGYVAAPSETGWRQEGWRRSYLVVAYFAGKFETSRKQLEALQWQLGRATPYGWGADMSLLPLEVAARTSPVRDQVETAEASRWTGDLAGAVRVYAEVAARTNLDERTRRFVQDRLTTLGMEQRLQEGEWISLLPRAGEDLPGWWVARGKCTRLADGALEAESEADGHIAYSRARIGTEFEVKGRFEIVRTSDQSFQAGLVMGTPEYNATGWYGFRLKRNPREGNVAVFSSGWSGNNRTEVRVPLNNTTNSFEFRYESGRVSASLNGTDLFRNVQAPANSYINTNEFLVGLGGFNDMNKTVIRYRDVQVRRLGRAATAEAIQVMPAELPARGR